MNKKSWEGIISEWIPPLCLDEQMARSLNDVGSENWKPLNELADQFFTDVYSVRDSDPNYGVKFLVQVLYNSFSFYYRQQSSTKNPFLQRTKSYLWSSNTCQKNQPHT